MGNLDWAGILVCAVAIICLAIIFLAGVIAIDYSQCDTECKLDKYILCLEERPDIGENGCLIVVLDE